MKQPFTAEELRSVMAYDPDTGHLTWVRPASPRLKAGDRAGSIGANGRREIYVLGRRCFAHHLAWFLHYGEWPTDYVRQKNGDYDDCRIDNLYRQTPEEMGLSKGMLSSNTSGYRGVSYDAKRHMWQASIRRKYKQIHLGYFGSAEEASAAFDAADKAFRPDVSREEMDRVASEMAIRRRQRALWALVLRQAGGHTGWTYEIEFQKEIGAPPGARYSLIPIDGKKPIGPGNWQWVMPRHDQFDMTTSGGRRDYGKHRRSVNPEVFWVQEIWRKYGIRPAEYYAMLEAQGGVCAICKNPETAVRDGKVKKLAIDHCHVTNRVRGLLCQRHNVMIGNGNDDVGVLGAAIEYLTLHKDVGIIDPQSINAQMFREQGGRCAGCGLPQEKMTSLRIDESGQVEGLQCAVCAAECVTLTGPQAE